MSASAPSDLSEIQKRFRNAVLSTDNAALTSMVSASGAIAARIAVYRATVQGSLIEVLGAAFPVVRRVVGDGFFRSLAGRFAAAAPPAVPQLSVYGGNFADFIAREDVGRRLPYLADTARLEWARGESYFAADAAPLDPARLAALSPDVLAQTILRWHPATRLVTSAFPIHHIWEINQPEVDDIPQIDFAESQSVLVSRRGHQIMTRAIIAADAAFMAAVASGKNLGEAADAALKADAAFDLQSALQAHFINGVFQG